jgi:hypothetical protein
MRFVSRSRLALAAMLALLALPSNADVSLFSPDDKISVETEPALDLQIADLNIYCPLKGASIYIDNTYVGFAPYSGNVPQGSHYIEVDVQGYYPLGAWFSLNEKTLYNLRFNPAQITGKIALTIEPNDASVTIDDLPVEGSLVEKPIGKHIVIVRHFGYSEQRAEVQVQEKTTSSVSVILARVPFAIGNPGFSRPVFNPSNTGAAGSSSLGFTASNYGSATAEIRAPDGRLVASLEYPDIKSWSQSSVWKGLDTNGAPLPDGIYTAEIIARAAPGVPVQADAVGPDGTIRAKAQVQIDSSLVVRPTGTVSAVPGLLFMPDPLPQPAGTLAIGASWFAPCWNPSASAFGFSASYSAGGIATFALDASAETSGTSGAADLAGSALVALFGDRTTVLGGAFFLRGGYSSASDPTLPGAGSAVEASLPLGLSFGVSKDLDLRLALSPGALADFESGTASFLGLGRAGLWLEGRSFRAGLSGDLPWNFSSALPSPEWPALTALEARLALGSTPFVASGYMSASIRPDQSPSFGIGLGLGMLF